MGGAEILPNLLIRTGTNKLKLGVTYIIKTQVQATVTLKNQLGGEKHQRKQFPRVKNCIRKVQYPSKISKLNFRQNRNVFSTYKASCLSSLLFGTLIENLYWIERNLIKKVQKLMKDG